ncbi:DUF4112 domain-containing protein [Flavobacterium sp.]|uniref:DUF4112 domain-containing protein n=1 Tax=Flavobacterium sp. TaxID=239 RepID=UPI00261404B2|nr:DUF4112 domain-containing protein [Flavobacterium sp.]
MPSKDHNNPTLKHLDALAKLMDSQFRFPGTQIRFGIDAIIGFIPGVGDFGGLLISGYMILVLAGNGASGFVMARISLNVIIDTLFGSIPVLGDIFDVAFKSNERNMKLVHQHYIDGKHQGSAWKVVVPVLLLLFSICAGIAWFAYTILSALFHYIW